MICESCGQKPATVHLTQMINNEVKKLHLCESCAAESGLDVNGAISITDVLLGLGGNREADSRTANKACPHCQMRLEDFRKSSRLGCQYCYDAFAEELEPLLQSMHRSLQHVGKSPSGAAAAPPSAAVAPTGNLAALRKALNDAVADENFEEAARIRDRIRALEEPGAAPSSADAATT